MAKTRQIDPDAPRRDNKSRNRRQRQTVATKLRDLQYALLDDEDEFADLYDEFDADLYDYEVGGRSRD